MRKGTVYLIHLHEPFGTAKQVARHYLGFTTNLPGRMQAHRSGSGARLLYHVGRAGIRFTLVRIWSGVPFSFEARLKALGSGKRLCPVCSPGKRWGQFKRD